MDQTVTLFQHFGFDSDAYRNKTLIDLGAGSRLRTKYFTGVELIAIEPLADSFRGAVEHFDLDTANEVHSTPAEDKIESLCGRADLVISMNVLDHCYDFENAMENVRDYLKPDGLAFLSFDKHEEADEMHPLELTELICSEIFERVGFKVEKCTSGFGTALGQHQTYGHGPYALNYWLRK